MEDLDDKAFAKFAQNQWEANHSPDQLQRIEALLRRVLRKLAVLLPDEPTTDDIEEYERPSLHRN